MHPSGCVSPRQGRKNLRKIAAEDDFPKILVISRHDRPKCTKVVKSFSAQNNSQAMPFGQQQAKA